MVPLEPNAKPGWLTGEINRHTGWFPKTSVEKTDTPVSDTQFSSYNTQDTFIDNNTELSESTEVTAMKRQYKIMIFSHLLRVSLTKVMMSTILLLIHMNRLKLVISTLARVRWHWLLKKKGIGGPGTSGRNNLVSANKVIPLYKYKVQNCDELLFEKDNIISVLGRDEPEWWRGELNGFTGLFPSNYVGPFV